MALVGWLMQGTAVKDERHSLQFVRPDERFWGPGLGWKGWRAVRLTEGRVDGDVREVTGGRTGKVRENQT